MNWSEQELTGQLDEGAEQHRTNLERGCRKEQGLARERERERERETQKRRMFQKSGERDARGTVDFIPKLIKKAVLCHWLPASAARDRRPSLQEVRNESETSSRRTLAEQTRRVLFSHAANREALPYSTRLNTW